VRIAALLVALTMITVGILGLVWPDSLMTLRRDYLATTVGLYAGGLARLTMGIVLILFAPASRAPKALRVLGAVICLQGLASALAPQFVGVDRARAVVDYEATWATALLRIGAVVALAAGGFIGFVATTSQSPKRAE
jgi:hypothetical protein